MFKNRAGIRPLIVKIRLFQTSKILLWCYGGELFEVLDEMGLVIKGG